MDIAAFLHPNLLSHLAIVAGARHRILATESWEDVGHKIRSQPIDVAVLDPMASGVVRADLIRALMDEFPSVPIILYSQLSPANLHAMIDLAREGVRRVVIYRFDDDPEPFLEQIESQPGMALAQMLLERISEPLERLKPSIRRTIERLFGAPGHFRTVDDLARAAMVSRRTIYRGFQGHGFASPAKFVSAAVLLRAYAYMLEPGNTLEIAANKMGIERHGLRLLTRQFFKGTPLAVKRDVSPEQFVARLADVLCPGWGGNPEH